MIDGYEKEFSNGKKKCICGSGDSGDVYRG